MNQTGDCIWTEVQIVKPQHSIDRFIQNHTHFQDKGWTLSKTQYKHKKKNLCKEVLSIKKL